MKFNKLVETIEKHPLFFLGERDISYLMRFLAGYYFSNAVRDTENDKPSIGEDADFEKFKIWVLKKYDLESNHSIERVINYYTMSKEEAFNKFFELWHEYATISNS